MSVSYTHLDVYKRQAIGTCYDGSIITFWFCGLFFHFKAQNSSALLSYTITKCIWKIPVPFLPGKHNNNVMLLEIVTKNQ